VDGQNSAPLAQFENRGATDLTNPPDPPRFNIAVTLQGSREACEWTKFCTTYRSPISAFSNIDSGGKGADSQGLRPRPPLPSRPTDTRWCRILSIHSPASKSAIPTHSATYNLAPSRVPTDCPSYECEATPGRSRCRQLVVCLGLRALSSSAMGCDPLIATRCPLSADPLAPQTRPSPALPRPVHST
jgi:hypothetical protein